MTRPKPRTGPVFRRHDWVGLSTALPMTDPDSPAANAGKITEILRAGSGHATLYRTATAGPSGQRASLPVGFVRYMPDSAWEFRIIDPATGEYAGYARREIADGEWWWSITVDTYDGFEWAGYAETLSLGCDVLTRGAHAATGRHDSRRTSPARWRSAASVQAQRAREHYATCTPCRAAGETRGYWYCPAG